MADLASATTANAVTQSSMSSSTGSDIYLIGDRLLVAVAERLSAAVRKTE